MIAESGIAPFAAKHTGCDAAPVKAHLAQGPAELPVRFIAPSTTTLPNELVEYARRIQIKR